MRTVGARYHHFARANPPTSTEAKGKSRAEIEHSSEYQVQHGRFESFDGTKIFYSVEGPTESKAIPLVFCYGLVCSSLHWTYQIDYFRHRHPSVWFDYRGHHHSDTPRDPGTLRVRSLVRDLKALLDHLGYKKVILLGHSMGVNVVLDFYREHPKMVQSMVIANGTARRPLETLFFGGNASQAFIELVDQIHKISPQVVRTVWKAVGSNAIIRRWVGQGGFNLSLSSPRDIDEYVKQVAQLDPNVFLRLILDYRDYDATPWLHEVKVPTLIIGGKKDILVPWKEQELIHQLIAGSELDIIEHGSHCTQLDLPELINLRIEKFIRDHQSRRTKPKSE